MRRVYVDVSNFRAPYDSSSLTLTGLGAWMPGRSYVDESRFRAPYAGGNYLGLGTGPASGLTMAASSTKHPAALSVVRGDGAQHAPVKLTRYLETGSPMGTFWRDFQTAESQVPWWVYLGLGLGAGALGVVSYRKFKKAKKGQDSGESK
jgi:LPXTG-motif cell wall-anchored protein